MRGSTMTMPTFPAVSFLVSSGKLSEARVEALAQVGSDEDTVLAQLVKMGCITWDDVARARIELARKMSPSKANQMLLQETTRAHKRVSRGFLAAHRKVLSKG